MAGEDGVLEFIRHHAELIIRRPVNRDGVVRSCAQLLADYRRTRCCVGGKKKTQKANAAQKEKLERQPNLYIMDIDKRKKIYMKTVWRMRQAFCFSGKCIPDGCNFSGYYSDSLQAELQSLHNEHQSVNNRRHFIQRSKGCTLLMFSVTHLDICVVMMSLWSRGAKDDIS